MGTNNTGLSRKQNPYGAQQAHLAKLHVSVQRCIAGAEIDVTQALGINVKSFSFCANN